jgi:hypothetical protein
MLVIPVVVVLITSTIGIPILNIFLSMAQSAELLDVFLKHYKSELCVHNSPEASCIW